LGKEDMWDLDEEEKSKRLSEVLADEWMKKLK
jgi:hypothetical protein